MNRREREGLAHHYDIDVTLPDDEFVDAVIAERKRRARVYWSQIKEVPVEDVTDDMVKRWAERLFGPALGKGEQEDAKTEG